MKQQPPLPAVDSPEVVKAMEYVIQWEGLPGFPRTDPGVLSLARDMASMCPAEKFDWLTARVLRGLEKCPTPLQLRRVCTASIPPKDGLEVKDVDVEFIAEGLGG